MKPAVFDRFSQIIYQKSGIVLKPEKQALLVSRIQKRLRARGLGSEADYLEIIELDTAGDELVELIDAISTNTTYFWREPEHFDVLSRLLVNWKAAGKSKIRIWCAAASTGQEPYTLAMEALEHLPPPHFDVKILATDVSMKALKVAEQGIYSEEQVSRLPSDKRKFFVGSTAAPGSTAPRWQVSQAVAQLVLFKKLNLVTFPYPVKGPLDIIFCRNVMIYFDVPTRQKIINEFYRLLAPQGFLFLSFSESLLGIEHSFSKFSISVYQKPV